MLPSFHTMTMWRETGNTRRERDDDMQQKFLAGVAPGTSRLHGRKPQDALLQTFIYPVLGTLDTNNPPATPCFTLTRFHTHPVNKLLFTIIILSVGHQGASEVCSKGTSVVGNERPTHWHTPTGNITNSKLYCFSDGYGIALQPSPHKSGLTLGILSLCLLLNFL